MMPLTAHPFLMDLLRTKEGAVTAPVPDDPAWEQIVTDSALHSLTPLLYRWLRASGTDRLLPPLFEQVKAMVLNTAAMNLALADELASILREFNRRGLVCLPLRGFAVAEQLDGEVTPRPMGDLDLLVRREALPDVAETLAVLGFDEIDRRPGFARTFSYTLEFAKARHGEILVEPHWTLAYPPFTDKLPMDLVWQRCAAGRVVGVNTWLLDRADLVLHLCFHLIHRSTGAPLLWWWELDRLLRRDAATLDWWQIMSGARQVGQERGVGHVLHTLQSLFGSPIPEWVVTQLTNPDEPISAQPAARTLDSRLADLLAREAFVDGVESFTQFFTLRGLRTKLRYALAILIPTPAFMMRHYGLASRRQLGLCYVTRLLTIAWEATKGLAGLLGLPKAFGRSSAR